MNSNKAHDLGLVHKVFNKFTRLHVIMLYVTGCIKHDVHAEDDDRTGIVIQRLAEISLSLPEFYAVSLTTGNAHLRQWILKTRLLTT